MTLLVASIEHGDVWMVADTALSDPRLGLRQQRHMLKLFPLRDSLIGFSGDAALGPRAIRAASGVRPGDEVLRVLLGAHALDHAVDFAYAYMDHGEARLYLVSAGHAAQVETLHLGEHDAFETFQRIRHDRRLDHPPDAIITLMSGVAGYGETPPPAELRRAILAMQRLVQVKQGFTAGGLVVPYIVSDAG